jgi:hypothetical protein
MEDWTFNRPLSGVPQGGIVSPILSNILLDKLDKYVEADDFLLGFDGPKSEAKEIKQRLRTFLQEQLKLELSEEKTRVTHARSETARFLGYQVQTLHEDAKQAARKTRDGSKADSRSINGKIGCRIPEDVIKARCQDFKPKYRDRTRNRL